MTRSLTLCTFFLAATVLQACDDVPIGSDGPKAGGDASLDATTRDQAADVATCIGENPAAKQCRTTPNECIPSTCSCSPDGFWHCTADCPVNVPLCADGGAPDKPASPDLPPDAVTCTGANPAAQSCRKTVNDCIPSSCSCSADGFWRCTADCPVNVPLCADGGTPDMPPDLPPDAPTCNGANPAARTCRKTTSDCIPSTCYCGTIGAGAIGTWSCSTDCLTALPLCGDGGVKTDADVCPAGQVLRYESAGCGAAAKPVCGSPIQDACPRPVCSCKGETISRCDYASEAFASFGACADGGSQSDAVDEASCLKATKVPVCNTFAPSMSITSAPGGPLLARVDPINGSCTGVIGDSFGYEQVGIMGWPNVAPGNTCDLLVTSTDGRTQLVTVTFVANPSPAYTCCGYPLDGHGMWVATDAVLISPSSVVVDFAADGGTGIVDGSSKDVTAL